MKVPEWNEYYKAMREKAPLVIHYPICGGGRSAYTYVHLGMRYGK